MVTINERNKIIAIYCGAIPLPYPNEHMVTFSRDILFPPDEVNGGEFIGTKFLSELKYHSSWDWIMPVCKKVFYYAMRVEDFYLITEIQKAISYYDIKKVHRCLYKAITEINERKKYTKQKHEQKSN